MVYPALGVALGLIGTAWGTKRQSERTRNAIRNEFGVLVGADGTSLPDSDVEVLEESCGFAPLSLRYLREMTGVDGWARFKEFVERVEELESLFDRRSGQYEALVTALKEIKSPVKRHYKTLGEFERSERKKYEGLFPDGTYPEYVSIECTVEHEEDFPMGGDDGDEKTKRDAVETVCENIERGEEIVSIYGDGGIGKSRLLIEVGKKLVEERDVLFVQEPNEFETRRFHGDTVILLDDPKDEAASDYLELINPSERNDVGGEHDVQIITAARPIYANRIDQWIRKVRAGGIRKVELQPLDEERTGRLLEGADLSKVAVGNIWIAAKGNPMFTRILAEAQKEDGQANELDKVFNNLVESVVDRTESDLADVAS